MALSLNTIKPAKPMAKKRKRVGRGNGSGHGTYSTRGLKGQNSRAGAGGLRRLGMRMMLRAVPKMKGIKPVNPGFQVVNFSDLEKKFKEGEIVTKKSLAAKGLVSLSGRPVKILGGGELKKKLKFEAVELSRAARKKIGV